MTLGPIKRWIMRSHIDWREKRVLAMTLHPEKREQQVEGESVRSHID